MNSKKINIIEFPSNLGLKKTESEIEPGVIKLPDWLKRHGFHSRINPEQVFRIDAPNYSMDLDKESGVRNADKIIEYSIQQSELLLRQLDGSTFQIIIGGDCSILIGNAIALKQKGNFGLFFLDGHTDFITPALSETGGAAGMDLAIVTGYGHNKLTNIFNLKPYFKEENVFCVGNRDFEEEYIQPILESEIEYFDLKRLRTNGAGNTANQFLELVQQHNLDGFFIHVDLDVLNDDIMPAVDSRAADGLTYVEFAQLLKPLLASDKAIGMEITILDPNLDKEGKYTIEFIRNFIEILEYGKANST
ncbi:MAG: arginase family protein [Chitinophagales bacterium]|nr:arginase family protein [Chitinophagales bacterium]